MAFVVYVLVAGACLVLAVFCGSAFENICVRLRSGLCCICLCLARCLVFAAVWLLKGLNACA